MKKKKTWTRNKNISRDSDLKWSKRDKCNKKKENKKENIYKRCSKKMKEIKEDKKMMKSIKDLKTLERKTSILKCLKNKKVIDNLKWKSVREELKNSWIKWLIMSSRKWIKNKSLRMKCFWDMKMKEKWDRDKSKIEDYKDKNKTKKKWETS